MNRQVGQFALRCREHLPMPRGGRRSCRRSVGRFARFALLELLLLCWLFPRIVALAQSPLPPTQFHVGPVEATGYADLDGDGRADVVLIDRGTGTVRAGFQLDNSGALEWTPGLAAGIYNITGVTAGRLLVTTRDTLALTAPESGRVKLVGINGSGAMPQLSDWIPPGMIGPFSLAAGQITGTSALEDLLLSSTWNGATENIVRLFINGGGSAFTTHTLLGQNSDRSYEQATRVLLANGATHQVAYYERVTVGTSLLRVRALNEAGSPLRLTVPSLPVDGQFVLSPFAGPLAQLVTYVPGAGTYQVHPLTFDGVNYAAGAPVSQPAGFAIGRIAVVAADNTARLLVIAAEGSQAVLRHTPDGTNSATFTPPAGEVFTSVVALPNGANGFQLLSGPGVTERSRTARSYKFNSGTGNYDLVNTTTLAPVSEVSGAGHVLVYSGEPFVAPNARVLSRQRSHDWSSSPWLGPPVSATGETFSDELSGLAQPAAVSFGAAPGGATHVLASQFEPQLSVFPLDAASGVAAGAVKPTPLPGTFNEGVAVTLIAPAGFSIVFRTQAGAAWQAYTQPIWLHRDTRLQAYATAGVARTAVLDVWYRFNSPAGQLSTLDDGIPDYVKLGLGFNPAELPDRAANNNPGNTLNYLQILLENTGVPLRHTSGTALELHVRPWSHDGLTTASVPTLVAGHALPDGQPNPGNHITVYDVSGQALDSNLAEHWGYFGANQTAAWLRGIGRAGRSRVTVAASSPSFALDFVPPYSAGSLFQGRELAGLVVLPASSAVTFVHPYGGGSDATEAAAWKAAAIQFYQTNPPPSVGATIDPLETTLTLVFEQWITRRFVMRGVLPASYLPTPGNANPNRLTLTAYRSSEPATPIPTNGVATGRVLPTPEQLEELERYRSPSDTGHLLGEVIKTMRMALRESSDNKLVALRAVTLDVYRISARWGGVFPGAFPGPLEALREFLATGVMPSAYRNDWVGGLPPEIGATLTPLTVEDYTAALQGLDSLLNMPSSRPVVTRDLRVRADSVGLNCTILDRFAFGNTVALVDANGRPYRFPNAFHVVPGLALQVLGFADVPASACATETLEVVRIGNEAQTRVTSVPLPSATDSDGNLLDDDWERLFFGAPGNDPFADLGGGYTLLQSYLDGSDPWSPGNYPPAQLGLPAVEIAAVNETTVQLTWHFPPAYAQFINFKLQTVPALGGAWWEQFAVVENVGGGYFRIVATRDPGADAAFWRLSLSLK
ncbi:MAG TPA: VCBS repeat-containing protein [Verrucomicrobiota bacterium]|nr:VCBS repeat-containing protein [Verrucomicrobiota bacterium]HNT13957.1 VCBS repeat-containing protein [Verrucomicrobiota bacterium]